MVELFERPSSSTKNPEVELHPTKHYVGETLKLTHLHISDYNKSQVEVIICQFRDPEHIFLGINYIQNIL